MAVSCLIRIAILRAMPRRVSVLIAFWSVGQKLGPVARPGTGRTGLAVDKKPIESIA